MFVIIKLHINYMNETGKYYAKVCTCAYRYHNIGSITHLSSVQRLNRSKRNGTVILGTSDITESVAAVAAAAAELHVVQTSSLHQQLELLTGDINQLKLKAVFFSEHRTSRNSKI